MFRSLIAAFSMYSRIPMPKIRWEEKDTRYMMCFFPLIGIVLGGVNWGAYLLMERYGDFHRLFSSAVLTALPLLLTGGIHMDGWMDTHDAIHSWKDREGRLEILKDPHVGAFAVISAILYMLLTAAGYSEIRTETIGIVAVSFVFSRTLSALSVVTFPKASAEGTVSSIGKNAAPGVIGILLGELAASAAGMILLDPALGITAVVVGLLVFAYYYRMSVRRFGGINGDLAGYFLCLCELMILLTEAVLGRILL